MSHTGTPHGCFSRPTHHAAFLTLSSIRFQLAWPPVVTPQRFLSGINLSPLPGKQLLQGRAAELSVTHSSGSGASSALPPASGWAAWSASAPVLRTRVPSQGFNRAVASELSPRDLYQRGVAKTVLLSEDGLPEAASLHF